MDTSFDCSPTHRPLIAAGHQDGSALTSAGCRLLGWPSRCFSELAVSQDHPQQLCNALLLFQILCGIESGVGVGQEVKCTKVNTVLCKSNASKLCEFRSLFSQTFEQKFARKFERKVATFRVKFRLNKAR